MGEACCGSRPGSGAGAGSKVQRAGPDQEAGCITADDCHHRLSRFVPSACLLRHAYHAHLSKLMQKGPKGSTSLSTQISSHLKSSFFLGVC